MRQILQLYYDSVLHSRPSNCNNDRLWYHRRLSSLVYHGSHNDANETVEHLEDLSGINVSATKVGHM